MRPRLRSNAATVVATDVLSENKSARLPLDMTANLERAQRQQDNSPKRFPRVHLQIQSDNGQKQDQFVFIYNMTIHLIHFVDAQKQLKLELGYDYKFTMTFNDGYSQSFLGRISYTKNQQGAFGVRMIRCSGLLKRTLGQQLMQFSSRFTPRKLQELDLACESVKEICKFESVTTDDDMLAVLELRRIAYSRAGKVSDDCNPEDLEDKFDQRAIILVAKHHDRVVASLRLILNDQNRSCEHEQFVVLPKNFPKREDIIEITRVCTHPDYRGSDLLQGLFQYASKIALLIDRPYIIGSSTPSLLGLYTRIGFHSTKIKYLHQDLNNQAHVIFLAKKTDILLGRGVNPLYWQSMYEDVLRFAIEEDIRLFATRRDAIRIRIFRILGRMTRKIDHILKNRRLRRSAYIDETLLID